MKDIQYEAQVYSEGIAEVIPNINKKVIYNAYIDGFNNAIDIQLVDDIIDAYVDYKAGVENGEIDEYEISSIQYVFSKVKGKNH